MIGHHLLISWRSIIKNKKNFAINITGLATGIACALFIVLWVKDELNTDKFFDDQDLIYQVIENLNYSDGVQTLIETSSPMAQYLTDHMPEVEYAAATIPPGWFGSHLLSVEDKNLKVTGQIVGKDYFRIFSYHFIAGDPLTVMQEPTSMVISKQLAISLLGNPDDALGKTIEFEHDKKFKVTGVFENIPDNSTIKFDFALSTEASKDTPPWTSLNTWDSSGPQVYLKVRRGTDMDQLNKKVALVRREIAEHTVREAKLVRFSDLYLHGNYENGKPVGGRIQYVELFSIIAMIILLIACINFMNLSTAQATKRLKEIGIKKLVGASRNTIISQFIVESLLTSWIALGIALLLVWYLLPQFNGIVGKNLDLVPDANVLLLSIGIASLSGLIAGSYPALYLSGMGILSTLKSQIKKSVGDYMTRKGLVVLQFSASIVLIFAVSVVYQQIQFVLTQNMGYDQEHIVVLNVEGQMKTQLKAFESRVRNLSGVRNVSSTTHSMVGHNWSWSFDWEGKDRENNAQFQVFGVDYNFVETMGMEMVAGRSFNPEFGTDTAGILLNQAAIKAMNLDDPIGKTVANGQAKIIGIVKDFHFKSLHDKIEPMIMLLMPHDVKYVMVRVAGGKMTQVLDGLQEYYKTFNPGYPFEYTFLDDKFKDQYQAEKRVAVLSRYFAGLAIIISCLGLLGLALHTTEQRTKEIGIRKILGASTPRLTTTLIREFIDLVLIAMVIATPLEWYLMNRWLGSFAYHIALQWWMFVGSGLLAVAIACITIGGQSLKVALMSPIQSVRGE